LLGSINLAALVRKPFTAEAALDLDVLRVLIPTAVHMLDNAIDVSGFPLPAQREEAENKRRIGLGITGLADALIFCGKRYGSQEAVILTRRWMAAFRDAAYLASVELAREKGSFPLFEKEAFLAGKTIRSLAPELRDAIAKDGIRNALVTSVAPTGTISLLADNISSGVEPVFSFTHKRHILQPDGSREEVEASDHAYRLFRKLKGTAAALPPAFVDAQSLEPAAHVTMQAVVQDYIDSSVSKTINLSSDIAFDAFKDVYSQAYDLGCKGCTTYRPNEVTGAVLEAAPEGLDGEDAPQDRGGAVVYMMEPLERPGVLPGRTYKLRWPESDHAIYITMNDIVQDGRRRPFEIFINSKNMEHYAWTLALTRMISAVFRRGGDVSFVVEELKAVFDPRGGSWMGGKYVPSLLAAIGEVIEGHMIAIGFLPEKPGKADKVEAVLAQTGTDQDRGRAFRQCPKCGGASLVRQEGCDLCTACGYSKCS
jgi:ribonucleoside-diphosphate reductase alpha chain